MADDIKNPEQTGLDLESQRAAVIKYVPVNEEKWTK